jgi:hypothetical protein
MLVEKLEQFRSRLLDKSRRNRLLNFKPKGNRSVQVFGHDLGDLYQWLVNDKKPLDFLARDTWRVDEADRASTVEGTGEGLVGGSLPTAAPAAQASNGPPSVEEVPVADLGDALIDLADDKLDSRLLFLAREAESAMQEQGCNILYIALGLLDWLDPKEYGGQTSAAPLVLVPVELTRRDAKLRHQLRAMEDDAVVNPTLIELCHSNYRLELPVLDPEADAPIDDFLAAVEELIAGPRFQGWSVRREIHVGLFSFAKQLLRLYVSDDWHGRRQRRCGRNFERPLHLQLRRHG